MAFAFGQIQPTTQGRIETVDLPLNRYLGLRFGRGRYENTAGVALENMALDAWYGRNGKTISEDEANARFGINQGPEPLVFRGPQNSVEAQRKHERRRRKLERLAYLESASSRILSLRGVAGIGVEMLGSVAHPVDFSLLFVPVIGSATRAAQLAKAGSAAWRVRLAKGLLGTEEAIARSGFWFPRFTSSFIDASVGNAVAEIPLFISKMRDEEIYGAEDSAVNVLAGGLFGGGLRVTLAAMARGLGFGRDIYIKMRPQSKEAMLRRAINDKLSGKDIDVTDIGRLDEGVLEERVRIRENEMEAKAKRDLDQQRDEIEEFARSQLAREGSLGTVNEKELMEIVEGIARGTPRKAAKVPARLDTAEFKRLRHLASRFRHGDRSVELFHEMADILRLVYDPNSRLGVPYFYRISDAPPRSVRPRFNVDAARAEQLRERYDQLMERHRKLREKLEKAGHQQIRFLPPGTRTQARRDIKALLAQEKHLKNQMTQIERELQPILDELEEALPGGHLTNRERAAHAQAMKIRNEARMNELMAAERERRLREVIARERERIRQEVNIEAAQELQARGSLIPQERRDLMTLKGEPNETHAAAFEKDAQEISEGLPDLDPNSNEAKLFGLDKPYAARIEEIQAAINTECGRAAIG